MSAKPAFERFEGTADRYAQFRPAYPSSLLAALQARIAREPPPVSSHDVVLDVGAGTGIFTRQLRSYLPPAIEVVGVEPGRDMRNTAIAASPAVAGLRYVEGTAEALPAADGSARAVLSATAAHWFDRPRYYAEVVRVLQPGGLLAIVQYVRDIAESRAAKASVDFLTEWGEPWAYERPDYAAELEALPGFGDFDYIGHRDSLALTPAQFVGLMLSSSHGRPVIEKLGKAQADEKALGLADSLRGPDGMIDYGYTFQAFTLRRRP